MNADDVESRQDSASIVHIPRVSVHAWIAEGNLSARASTVESDWFANSARAA